MSDNKNKASSNPLSVFASKVTNLIRLKYMDSAEGAKYLKKYMADGEFIVSLFEKDGNQLVCTSSRLFIVDKPLIGGRCVITSLFYKSVKAFSLTSNGKGKADIDIYAEGLGNVQLQLEGDEKHISELLKLLGKNLI
jgi:hypothetical protein